MSPFNFITLSTSPSSLSFQPFFTSFQWKPYLLLRFSLTLIKNIVWHQADNVKKKNGIPMKILEIFLGPQISKKTMFLAYKGLF